MGLSRSAAAQCTNSPVRGPAVRLYSTLPCYAVSVTPDGSTTPQRVVNTSGYTASFTVKNTGYNGDTFSFTCSGSGGVTCTARTPTSKTLLSGATTTVTATYSTGSVTGTGTLTLTATGASGQSSDNGYYSVPIGSYGVAVTPDGAPAANRTANTSGYSETFTVTNSGTIQNTYTLSCTGATGVSCGTPSPASLTLAGNTAGTVSMPYSVGAAGTGTLTLTASGTSASDNGSFSIPIVAAAVAVTPDGSTTAPRPANTGGYSEVFTVTNPGAATTTYSLTCSGANGVTCGTFSPTSVAIAAGGNYSATIPYSVGAPQTGGRLTLTASGAGASDAGYFNVPIPGGAPVVTLADGPYANQDLSRCAVGCFAATYSQSTVPYFSMGAGQAVTLVYNGDRAKPRPFVHVDVQVPSGSAAPTDLWLQAKVNGVQVTFVNGETTLKFQGTTSTVRLGGQFDGSGYATGVYPLDLTVTSDYPTGAVQTTISTKLTIVNEAGSPIAAGWTLAGVQRLRFQSDSSILLTDGTGSAWVFTKTSCPQCTPVLYGAPGEVSQIVVDYDPEFPTTVSDYRRVYPDSTTVMFDVQGYMNYVQDRFGNTTGISYDASLRPSSVSDPLSRAITLGYGANGLSSVQDAAGRTTTVTVQADHSLTRITDPDNFWTGFGYDASARLSTITDRRGNTSTLGYAASWKLASVTAPAVAIFGVGTVSPVTQFAAWQAVGVPYASTATPVPAPTPDTIRATVTEPGGAQSRFTVNGWGQPLATTDAMGNVTTVTYDANGFPFTSISPTYAAGQADTTWFASSGLLTKAHAVGRPAVNIHYGAYAQPDSIWGDSLPTRGFTLSAKGQVLTERIGGIGRGRVTYDLKGRVDSVFDATSWDVTKYFYDAVNGNPDSVLSPGGMTRYTYDAAGRAVTAALPALVPQTSYYSVVNRVDSVRAVVGGGVRAVKYAYDPLLLTSVTDPKGQVYGLSYNALGWLTQQTDPAMSSEQYAYSRDGDLVQWTNRRGQAVAFAYDSLHRIIRKSGTNTDSLAWTYSPPSQRTVTAASPASVETTYFDLQGQPDSVLTTLVGPGQTFRRRYTYNLPGYLVVLSDTGGGIRWAPRQYGYDMATGALHTLTIAGQTTTIGADANFQPTSTTLPGGDVVTRAFGSLHAALNDSTASAYGATTNHWLAFQAGGRLQQQYTSLGAQPHARVFAYDSLGQLVKGSNQYLDTTLPQNCLEYQYGYDCVDLANTNWQVTDSTVFGYDSVGNRTDQGGSYLTGNRIASFAGCSYTTDADGNVASRTCSDTSLSATYSWTAESQLRSVQHGGTTTTFRYDAGGHLVRIETNGVASRHFLWNGTSLLAELDSTATGSLAEYSYYPGLDHLHAVIRGTTFYAAQTDGGGNVTALTDTAKVVQRSYTYDDWGNLTGGSDVGGFAGADRARWKGALSIGLPGGELYYMRSRWYEPHTGRFLSEDPNGLAGGMNDYAYAGDDPINHIDPTGETWTCNYYFNVDVGTQDNPILISHVTVKCEESEPALTWMRDARWGYGVDPYAIAPVLGPLPTPPPTGRRAPVMLGGGRALRHLRANVVTMTRRVRESAACANRAGITATTAAKAFLYPAWTKIAAEYANYSIRDYARLRWDQTFFENVENMSGSAASEIADLQFANLAELGSFVAVGGEALSVGTFGAALGLGLGTAFVCSVDPASY